MPGVHTLVELLDDRREHEPAERKRQECGEVVYTESKNQNSDRHRGRHRHQELPLEVRHRRSAPSDQRSDSSQQQQ